MSPDVCIFATLTMYVVNVANTMLVFSLSTRVMFITNLYFICINENNKSTLERKLS